MFGHITFMFTRIPIQNPQYYEEKYYSIWSMIQLNGHHVVQAFFIISGLLVGIGFKDIIRRKSFKFKYLWVSISYRYIRLTPVYAIVVLYETTSLARPKGHPFWELTVKTQLKGCQNNWWTNLLYINNIINVSDIVCEH